MHNTFWFATEMEQWMAEGNSGSCWNLCVTTNSPPILDPEKPGCCSAVFNAETDRDVRAMYVDKSGICSNGILQ